MKKLLLLLIPIAIAIVVSACNDRHSGHFKRSENTYIVDIGRIKVTAYDNNGRILALGDSVCIYQAAYSDDWRIDNSDKWQNTNDTGYRKESMGVNPKVDTLITKYRLGIVYRIE